MSSPERDQHSNPKQSQDDATFLDLSDEDDDTLWARRPFVIIPTEDANEYLRRRYLDSSQRYDAVVNNNLKSADQSQQTVHLPGKAAWNSEIEVNRAIETLSDTRTPETFLVYEQEGLGPVSHCMWCGVEFGQVHRVDCKYLHHLCTERGFLMDVVAPRLPTLLLQKGSPFPDVRIPYIKIDAHTMLISHLKNTGQLENADTQDAVGAIKLDDKDLDGLDDLVAEAQLPRLDAPFGAYHSALSPFEEFARSI